MGHRCPPEVGLRIRQAMGLRHFRDSPAGSAMQGSHGSAAHYPWSVEPSRGDVREEPGQERPGANAEHTRYGHPSKTRLRLPATATRCATSRGRRRLANVFYCSWIAILPQPPHWHDTVGVSNGTSVRCHAAAADAAAADAADADAATRGVWDVL